jgi:hypothetical protein
MTIWVVKSPPAHLALDLTFTHHLWPMIEAPRRRDANVLQPQSSFESTTIDLLQVHPVADLVA